MFSQFSSFSLVRVFARLIVCVWGAAVFAPNMASAEDFSDYYDLVYQIRVVSPQAASKSSIGSGFQVSADGLLITNYHVIAAYVQFPDTHEIEYRSFDGEQGALQLLDFDVVNDLAVLRLAEAQSRYFEFADDAMNKGEVVYALGNPRDYGVSLVPGPNNGMVEHSYNDQILFSGSLNPGMSGGPAVNDRGQVVGVNVATAGAALSFLIPSSKARSLIQSARSLEKSGYSDELAAQIKAWQRDRLQALIDDEWPIDNFAGESLFGEIRNDFQCWGDSNDSSKRRTVESVSKSCRSANSIFLAGNLNTGQINYYFEKNAPVTLTASQFFARMDSNMGADNQSNFDNSTGYRCRNDFVGPKLGRAYKRITSCIRAYKRLPGLFDSLLLVERLGAEESLVTHLSIAGAEQDQISSLNQKFVEASLNE